VRTPQKARNFLLVLLAVTALAAAGRQDARADSKYALVFLGDQILPGDVRAIGLGSHMQLLEDSLALQYNPATLAAIRKFTFAANVYFTSDRARSEEFEETDVDFQFSSLMFAVPLTSRLSAGLGYRGRYDASSSFVLFEETGGGEAYQNQFIRKGGLISFPILAGVRVTNFLEVGGYYALEKGKYEDTWFIVFDDASKNTSTTTKKSDLSGTGFGAGVVLRPPGGLTLGVTYESEIDYDADVTLRFTNPVVNNDTTGAMLLPERWVVSGAWRFHRMFSLYGTYSYSDFTKFQGLAFPQSRLYAEHIISGGFEYLRGFQLRKTRFPLRLGATYSKLPYDFPEGKRINSYMAELGMGLIFRSGKGKVDLTLQAGLTGDLSTNNLENTVIRFFVGLSGAEVWRRHRQSGF